LRQGEAEFSVTYQLVQAFIALLHQQTDQGPTEWLEQAQKSAVAELTSFAKGLVSWLYKLQCGERPGHHASQARWDSIVLLHEFLEHLLCALVVGLTTNFASESGKQR